MDDMSGWSEEGGDLGSKRPGWPVDPYRVQRALLGGFYWLIGGAVFALAIGVLYVPVPQRLRRRTKVFIDSLVDNLAEGLGAAFILLWLSLLHWPAGRLAVPTLLVSASILELCSSCISGF